MFSFGYRYRTTCHEMKWTVLGALIDLQARVEKADKVRWWNPFTWSGYLTRPTGRICPTLLNEYDISYCKTRDARTAVSQTGSAEFPVKGDGNIDSPVDLWDPDVDLWDPDFETGANRRKLLADMITYYQGTYNAKS